MWELDCEEGWAPKNWCFWTVVLEKILESPLDCKKIQPVHPKGDQSWVFIGRTDAKAETPILWPPHAKSWLIGKDSDAGRDWGEEEKGTTEDEMAGWNHRLDGHGFGWTPGVGDGQGGLAATVHGVTESQTWLSDWTELTPHTSARVGVQTPTQPAPEWVSYAALCCPLTSPSPGHLSVCMCAQSLSHVQHFATPWTVACQAPWDSPGKNTELGCHGLLLGIFLTQELNLCLLCLLCWLKQEGRE